MSKMEYGVSISALPYNLQIIVVKDGVFERGQVSNGIEHQDMQAKYADIIPS